MFIDASLRRYATVGWPLSPGTISVMEGINITHGDDLRVCLFEEFIDHVETPRACSYDADSDSFRWRLSAGRSKYGIGDEEWGSDEAKRCSTSELPGGDIVQFGHLKAFR